MHSDDETWNRDAFIEELDRRLNHSNTFRERVKFYWKRYSWVAVVGLSKSLKRILDFTLSLIALVLLSPLFLLIALIIMWDDPGPVFYRSTRIGKWGKAFSFPKFRTMYINAEEVKTKLKKEQLHINDPTFKMKKDPRVTPFGRLLRKTSLDELPQLWNVLRGEMSLVGPRPPIPEEVAKYSLKQRQRLDIVPGLTCFWQVSGRSDLPFDQQVQLDVEYIKSQNFWTDVKILLKTIPAVLSGRGAY